MKGRDFEYEFTRNDQGKIDFSGKGSYRDQQCTIMIPKYASGSRFLFGVATVKLPSGEVVGKRLKPLCYTGKKIISCEEWQFHVNLEIEHVKREGNKKTWCKKIDRSAGQLWEDESVTMMKG
eukprot:5948173-Ditylum_brightwellii.AAC.1